MTDEDRREAERLANSEYEKIAIMRKVWTWPEGFVGGYAAGRESMLVEYAKLQKLVSSQGIQLMQHLEEIGAERERSQKLVEVLDVVLRLGYHAELIKDAIAEYEATRD